MKSLIIVTSLTLAWTANAFTVPTIAKPALRTSSKLYNGNMDTSRMSLDELRRIANKKGYDTLGMDRTGLEMIVRGWGNTVNAKRTSQDQIVDITDIIYSEGEYIVDYGDDGGESFTKQKEIRNKWKVGKVGNNKASQNTRPAYRPPSSSSASVVSKPKIANKAPNDSPYGPRSPPSWVDTQNSQQQQLTREQSQQRSQSGMPYSYTPPQAQSQQQRQGSRQGKGSYQNSNANNNMQPRSNSVFKDSMRAAVVGFFTGGIAVSPVSYLHNIQLPSEIIVNEMSQFEFDILTGGIAGAAFAMLYRYFVTEDKDESFVSALIAFYPELKNIYFLFFIIYNIAIIESILHSKSATELLELL